MYPLSALRLIRTFSDLFGELHFMALLGEMFCCCLKLQRTMIIQCIAMAFLFMTFTLTEKAGEWMYFIWVCLMFGTFCGNFALFPAATAKAFGQKYFTVNYGMVFSSQVWELIYN